MTDPFSFIEQAYAAILQPERWSDVLNSVSEITGAFGCGLVSHDAARTASTLHSDSLKIADSDYRNHWWRHDTRIIKAKRMSIPNGQIITDKGFMDCDDKARDPFFQDFCRPYKMDEIAAYFADDPLGGTMTVSIFRGSDIGLFDGRELLTLNRIAPHVARAFNLTVSLSLSGAKNIGLMSRLSHDDVGAIFLEHNGLIKDFNEAAYVSFMGVANLTKGHPIRVLDVTLRRSIDKLIAAASPIKAVPTGGTLVLSSPLGLPTHHISAMPVRFEDSFLSQIGVSTGGVLVTIKRLTAEQNPSVQSALQKMGLTPTEAKVAESIGLGKSPKEIADRHRVSASTVRTQMRSIYHKLSINRQSELAVLISKIR